MNAKTVKSSLELLKGRLAQAKALAARLVSDDRGQTTAEYILILAVVVMIAMQFKTRFKTQMTRAMDQFDKGMGDALNE